MGKFYITTAIDYVNAEPHIGHAYQKIAADVLARYHRIRGEKVFYLTGTDEHGSKILSSADEKNIPVRDLVNSTSSKFKKAWKSLDIKYDRFIRTTDEDHRKAVQKFIKQMYEKGDIYKGEYEGLYCEGCERYLTEKDLVDGKCPFHKKAPQSLKEEAYFFKLSKYEDKLLELYEENPEYISPKKRRKEVINRVKEGLRDLCITRTGFDWGIPFPIDKKHVVYVWYEALLNYLTGIGWPNKKYKEFWPADVELLGKDNSWFHCVIWPAMLMSMGIKPAKKIYIHGFLTFNGQKISKSLGNVIRPETLVKKYGSDAIRYYILRDIAFGEDGDFSERNLVQRYNTELADELGNLLSRSTALIQKNGEVPKGKFKLKEEAEETMRKVDENLEKLEFHIALRNIWEFVRSTNKYIQNEKPWEEPENLKDILYTIAEALRIISFLTYPFIPNSSREIAKQLGIKDITKKIEPGTKVKKGEILFKKMEYEEEDPFSKVDFKVARVEKVEDVEGADKLIKLQVNLGDGKRQIVAGLKKYYSKEELEGENIILVANLKPARLCGELSEGMLLAAEKNDKVRVIFTDKKAGSEVFAEGIEKKPENQIKIDHFAKLKLKTNDKGEVIYKEKKLKAGDKTLTTELENAKVR